jgi:hypothetical protein
MPRVHSSSARSDPFRGPARHAWVFGLPLAIGQVYVTGRMTPDMPQGAAILFSYLSVGLAPFWGPACVVMASKVGGWFSGFRPTSPSPSSSNVVDPSEPTRPS